MGGAPGCDELSSGEAGGCFRVWHEAFGSGYVDADAGGAGFADEEGGAGEYLLEVAGWGQSSFGEDADGVSGREEMDGPFDAFFIGTALGYGEGSHPLEDVSKHGP